MFDCLVILVLLFCTGALTLVFGLHVGLLVVWLAYFAVYLL